MYDENAEYGDDAERVGGEPLDVWVSVCNVFENKEQSDEDDHDQETLWSIHGRSTE